MTKYFLVAKIYRRSSDGEVEEVRSFDELPIDVSENKIPLDVTLRISLNSLVWPIREFMKELRLSLLGREREMSVSNPLLEQIEINPQSIPVKILDDERLGANISINQEIDDNKIKKGIVTEANSESSDQFDDSLDITVDNGSLKDDNFSKDDGNMPLPLDIRILVRKKALKQVHDHAEENTLLETGGALMGKFVKNENGLTVIVTGIVRGHNALREGASVNITADTWADIWRSIDADPIYQDEKHWRMVGWYHTHPNFGIFYSGADQEAHRRAFRAHGHIGLVIDPIRNDYGFFCWNIQNKKVLHCPEGHIESMTDDELLFWLKKEKGLNLELLPSSEIKSVSESNNVGLDEEDTDNNSNKTQKK